VAENGEEREDKPPEEPHPDEPRGTSLPPAEDPATQPDPQEGEPTGEEEKEEPETQGD
jgi:hypothetical protein